MGKVAGSSPARGAWPYSSTAEQCVLTALDVGSNPTGASTQNSAPPGEGWGAVAAGGAVSLRLRLVRDNDHTGSRQRGHHDDRPRLGGAVQQAERENVRQRATSNGEALTVLCKRDSHQKLLT